MSTPRRLDGKIAVITGGARGIGKGCALELAREGATVVVNDRPDSPDLATTVAELSTNGKPILSVEADAFTEAGCEEIVEATLSTYGRIDILVSNPAYGARCDYLDYKSGDFEKIIAATLTSGFHMSRLVARAMVTRGEGGKILFISSVQAELPVARCVGYGTAKAGLNHMATTLAVEMSKHRINVNVIEPGWIDTPGERETFGDEAVELEGRRLPLGRLGTPGDIGRAAVFLCSDDADYISGAILPVDGLYRFKDCRAESQLVPKGSKS
jgi:glucose 1-dehydrogenase